MKQHKSHDWNICSCATASMMLVQSSHLLLLWALDLSLLRVPELHNITSMPGASLLPVLCNFQLALFIMSLLTVGCSGDYFCLFQSLPSLAAVCAFFILPTNLIKRQKPDLLTIFLSWSRLLISILPLLSQKNTKHEVEAWWESVDQTPRSDCYFIQNLITSKPDVEKSDI